MRVQNWNFVRSGKVLFDIRVMGTVPTGTNVAWRDGTIWGNPDFWGVGFEKVFVRVGMGLAQMKLRLKARKAEAIIFPKVIFV